MSKTPKKPRRNAASTGALVAQTLPQAAFDEVLGMIEAARTRAIASVNTTLIDLYWNIGKYISGKLEAEGWGKGTVQALAEYIRQRRPNAKGYSPQNLWRMRQFFETYRDQPKLSAMLRELDWTHNLLIMGKSKREEEREFYLRVAISQKWPSRELERQINSALFERVALAPPKLSALLRDLHPGSGEAFKDSYMLEFLELPPEHSEADLQHALVEKLKQFLIELGRDFCFIGSQYVVQVGSRDFAIDLLFFHRGLNCLVAIELKVAEFQPEHFGKLEFYLEALDRDVRKAHEQPSIGVLLCKTKDSEIVEYALSRTVSPALVAEYQTRLPNKKLLQAKLHEFYELAQQQTAAPALEASETPPAKPRKPSKRRKP